MSDPTFGIQIPTTDANYTAVDTPVAIGGNVSTADFPIVSVQWWNDATGQGGDCDFSGGAWSGSVPLAEGLNHISAWATNSNGETQGDSFDVTFQVTPPPAGVTVYWTKSVNPDIIGYKVYCGNASGVYNEEYSPRSAGNVSSYFYPLPDITATWYFAVTGYDSAGNESPFSAEMVYSGSQNWTVIGHGTGTVQALRGTGAGYQKTQGSGAGNLKALRGSGTGTASPAQVDSFGGGTFKPIQGLGLGELITPISSYGIGYFKPLVGAGAGTVGVTGTGAGTLKRLTGTGAGNVGVSGTGAGTVKHLTGVGTGTVGVTGTGAGTLEPLQGDGTGLVPTTNPTGPGAGTLLHLTGAGTGTVGRIQHIPPGKAKKNITGSGHGTFKQLLGAGAGLVTFPEIDGAGDATFQALTGAGAGSVSAAAISSTGAGTVRALTGAGGGLVSLPAIDSTGAGIFRALTGAGTGGLVPEDITSDGAGTLAALTGQGTGYVNIPSPVVSGAMLAVEWYEIAGFLLPFYVCAKARSSGPVTPEMQRGHPIMADPCPQECSVG